MTTYIENLKERYEDAVRNEPIVALAEGFAHRGEMTKIDSLKMAVVELIGVNKTLLKQVLYGPPLVVIFKNEPPVSAEQVQIMEAMKDQLVQSMGIPVSLMTADGCNYSGSKVAQEMFQKQLGVEPNEDQFR